MEFHSGLELYPDLECYQGLNFNLCVEFSPGLQFCMQAILLLLLLLLLLESWWTGFAAVWRSVSGLISGMGLCRAEYEAHFAMYNKKVNLSTSRENDLYGFLKLF